MIELIPFATTDFDTLIAWVDSEETLVQFAGRFFKYPLTAEQLATYIKDKKRHIYKVVYVPTGITIGHAEICFKDGENTALLCRICIGVKNFRGKGYGQQITNRLLRISFEELGAEKAELNVFDWNKAAITCYRKAGFEINPSKTYTREVNGKTWTALNMTLAKAHWRKLQQGLAANSI